MNILHYLAAIIASLTTLVSGLAAPITVTVPSSTAETSTHQGTGASSSVSSGTAIPGNVSVSSNTASTVALAAGQTAYTNAELLARADNTYADGSVPLGDYKYVTSAPKKGYIYLCHANKDNPGSMVNGPWMHGDTWNFLQKVKVDGSVSWSNATFSDVISGAYRVLSGNDLPLNHNTGVFPVAKSSDAGKYDPNPNTISAQVLHKSIAAEPAYSSTPYCMGGEVGVMLSGVPLFNGFDAGLRDAAAHELQDSCDGHPQGSGEYHYHSLSSCFKDISETTTLGFAYDGFPITGPLVAPGKYLTTTDLDECHGVTSEIIVDGKKKTTYHYVMTQDFPYSASCFRAKPISTRPSAGTPTNTQNSSGTATTQNQAGASTQSNAQAGPQGQGGGTPPQAALDACMNLKVSASCIFTTPNGSIQGTCQTPPNQTQEACVPQR